MNVSDHDNSLYEELARAEAYVRTLRREVNFRSLVARLPIEVLALIFSYFPASDDDLPRRAAPPPSWLAVTHVCQRWRQAALSFPNLWTNIILWNPHWTKEMIARSKMAPLSLVLAYSEFDKPPPAGSTSFAFSHTSRARLISLSGVATAHFFAMLAQHPAPFLETLELSQPCYSNSLRCLDLSQVQLFHGRTPRLRTLKLSGGPLSWSSSLFQPSITSLELEATALDQCPSIEDLLKVLATTPNLQSSVLVHTLPRLTSGVSFKTVSPRLHLPHLRFIAITARMAATDVYSFISSITYPADAAIQLTCDEFVVVSAPAKSTIHTLLRLVSDHHCGPSDMETMHAGTFTDAPKGLRIYQLGSGWALLIGALPSGGSSTDGNDRLQLRTAEWVPHIHICLKWNLSNLSRRQSEMFFTMACQLFPVHNITMIDVDSDSFTVPAMWWTAFARLTHVKTLSVRGKAVLGFTVAFTKRAAKFNEGPLECTPDEDREPELLFPELSKLGIGRIPLSGPLLETFEEGLSRRNGDEGEIETLTKVTICDCDVQASDIADLANYTTAEVDWDHKFQGYTKLMDPVIFRPW